jgi:preprotein translocase subunit SecA
LHARRSVARRAGGWGNFSQLFKGDPAKKTRERLQPTVDQINALDPGMQSKSDEELREVTQELRKRAQANESLDSLLPEAFAVRASDTCLNVVTQHRCA